MKVKKVAALVSALLGGLLSAQASFAADTKCTVVYWNGITLADVELDADNQEDILDDYPPVSTIAVASNFYAPAIDLVKTFTTNAGVGTYSSLGVCHNATGHLANEIKGNNPAVITGEWLSAAINYKYSLFFAADADTPFALFASLDPVYTTGFVKLYASGIPALLLGARKGIQADQYLVIEDNPGKPSGVYRLGGLASEVIMDVSHLSRIAIGNRVDAPYGKAGTAIIKAMGQWSVPDEISGDPLPDCEVAITPPGICEYDNIDITFNVTVDPDSNIDAGWVSLAQIIAANNSNLRYVYFPSYAIPQTGVRLANPNPTGADVIATALWSFVDIANPNDDEGAFHTATGQTWNQWLVSKGYGQLPDPNGN